MPRFSLWILFTLALGLLVALAPASRVIAQDAGETEAQVAVDEPAEENGSAEEDEHSHAAEDHPASPLLNVDVGAAIWNLLIFAAVFLILAMFVWPPILKGLQAIEANKEN